MTLAGAARSMTDTRSSGIVRDGSAGSIFVDAVTSASDPSGEMATLSGGPTIDVGTASSPTTFGGEAPRSRMVIVSAGGLRTGVTTPSTSVTFDSLAEMTICAAASDGQSRAAATNGASVCMACEE